MTIMDQIETGRTWTEKKKTSISVFLFSVHLALLATTMSLSISSRGGSGISSSARPPKIIIMRSIIIIFGGGSYKQIRVSLVATTGFGQHQWIPFSFASCLP